MIGILDVLVIALIVSYIGCAMIAANIASEKQRSELGWFLAAILCGPWVMIAVAAIEPLDVVHERERRKEKSAKSVPNS